jgi:FdhD protein
VTGNPSRSVVSAPVVRIAEGGAQQRLDRLAAEEPLEVRVNGDAVSVTMRTPGHDLELALGFCLTEGLAAGPRDVATARMCASDGGGNVVDVRLRDPAPVAEALRRNTYTASSCGVCGTTSIDLVRRRAASVAGDPVRVDARVLSTLPQRMRAGQRVFERTGGLHAAALFTASGGLRCLREDVGRHNAVDKVLGWAAVRGALPLRGHILLVSGRVAFEIAQKALVTGVPVLAAVSAPSSLAVELARDTGMTLVGFLRGQSMNVYAGEQRLGTP